MVQYPLLVDSFENAIGFRSDLIPYKILETILCQNFAKKIDFLGNFGLPFSCKVCKWLKTFTILNRIYLRSFLNYFWEQWAHPFFVSGAPIKLISAEVKCYDKFVTRRNYGNFYIKHD